MNPPPLPSHSPSPSAPLRAPGADALLAELAGRLGAQHVLTGPSDLDPYLVESRGLYRGSALAAVRPRDTEEVAFVVAACRGAGVPVVAQGGNTGLVGGGLPLGGVVVSLARLDAIGPVAALDATITVGAGAILADVQTAADAAGLLFPLSWAAEGSVRIGGALATNAGGTGVLAYGNTRDLVLGIEVVLADGRIWNGLRSLRKNNTGYDLRHLFVGSEGTLGIITAAVLRLFPKPVSRSVAFVGLRDARATLDLFADLRRGADRTLTAFEAIPPFGLEIVLRHLPGAVRPLQGRHGAYALVELSATRTGSDTAGDLEAMLAGAIDAGLVEDATIARSEAQNAALWALRENLSEVQRAEGGSIKHDVSVPVSRIADFLEEATAACEAAMPGLRVCAFGHVGDGNVHFNLSQPPGMDKAAFLAEWARFNRIVHDIVHRMGGAISAEHGIGLIKRDELLRYGDPVGLDLMRRIKAALDPDDILNPGKVIAQSANPPPALPV